MKRFFSRKRNSKCLSSSSTPGGKKIFLLEWEHLNFTCTFRGTMKRISREFYSDLSGNRCTKVAPRRSSRLSVYLEIFPTVVDQCVIVKAGK